MRVADAEPGARRTPYLHIANVRSLEQFQLASCMHPASIGLELEHCTPAEASSLAAAVRGASAPRALLVGQCTARSADQLAALRADLQLGCIELSGAFPAELAATLLPHAYPAVASAAELRAVLDTQHFRYVRWTAAALPAADLLARALRERRLTLPLSVATQAQWRAGGLPELYAWSVDSNVCKSAAGLLAGPAQ